MPHNDIEQLEALRQKLEGLLQDDADTRASTTQQTKEAVDLVGESWSGSSLGYHANVYYKDFQVPPPGAHFSMEWGLIDSMGLGTSGSWSEYVSRDVKAYLRQLSGVVDLNRELEWANRGEEAVEAGRSLLQSVLSAAISRESDAYLSRLLEAVDKVAVVPLGVAARVQLPRGELMSRDPVAMSQGLRVAPHQEIFAEVGRIKTVTLAIKQLRDICENSASHLLRLDVHRKVDLGEAGGSKVFLGHGRSAEWRKLKDFLQDRLTLPWDEFNRVPVAGQTNIARLSSMLDDASIAFVIMTAEDEMLGGESRARENVVHEVGLFQGRLGFGKAIVLLEDGCNEFSNISGLGQIRFPSGRIEAVFEEIRLVLEREGLLPGEDA